MNVELGGPWWAWVLIFLIFLAAQGRILIEVARTILMTIAEESRRSKAEAAVDELAARRDLD